MGKFCTTPNILNRKQCQIENTTFTTNQHDGINHTGSKIIKIIVKY